MEVVAYIRVFDIAENVFNGIFLMSRWTVWFWSLGLTDEFSHLRGMDKMVMDFYDNPDGVHSLMGKLRDGTLNRLKSLEANDLLAQRDSVFY